MKKQNSKLTLNQQTLRNLTENELKQIVGAGTITAQVPCLILCF